MKSLDRGTSVRVMEDIPDMTDQVSTESQQSSQNLKARSRMQECQVFSNAELIERLEKALDAPNSSHPKIIGSECGE